MNNLQYWIPTNIYGWIGVVLLFLAILWHKALSGFSLVLMLVGGFYLYFIVGQGDSVSTS